MKARAMGAWQERAIAHALSEGEAEARAILREEALSDDDGAWAAPPSISERALHSHGACARIEMARAALRSGNDKSAMKYQEDAHLLLKAARATAVKATRSKGGTKAAETKREAAAEHWALAYLKRAHAELSAEGRKRIGDVTLSKRARRLASAAGVPDTKRDEITEYRAGQFRASITR